jgi:hypothetical protein
MHSLTQRISTSRLKKYEYFCGEDPGESRYVFKGPFMLLEARYLNNNIPQRADRNFKLDLKIWFETLINPNQTNFFGN